MCRVFAGNNGYNRNLFLIGGFLFGVWAVLLTILLPNRTAAVVDDQPERSAIT